MEIKQKVDLSQISVGTVLRYLVELMAGPNPEALCQ